METTNMACSQDFIVQNILNHMNQFSVHVIDSPPGTGKTYTLKILNEKMQNYKFFVLVYSNALVNDFASQQILSMTCCKFLMKSLSMSPKKAFEYFEEDGSAKEMLYHVYESAFRAKEPTIDILFKESDLGFFDIRAIVLDEYTTMSPWYIIWLYFLCKIHNKALILVGDKNQQASIQSSRHFNNNNYALASLLLDFDYSLTVQYRNKDKEYNEKLDQFKTLYINSAKNTVINIFEKYFIYKWLYPKFHTQPQGDVIYLTSYHKKIREKLAKIKHRRCNPIHLAGGVKNEMSFKAGMKQLSYIPLVVGFIYQFRKNIDSPYIFGVLINILDDMNYLQFLCGNEKISIGRVDLMQTQHLELKNFCEKNYKYNERCGFRILQFDARLAYLTYHAVQGLTLQPEFKLELDLDGMSINAIYVGLSRIVDPKQLQRIETSEIDNFEISRILDDGHLYKIHDKGLKKLILGKKNKVAARRIESARNIEEFNRKLNIKIDIELYSLANQSDGLENINLFKKIKYVSCNDLLSREFFYNLIFSRMKWMLICNQDKYQRRLKYYSIE